MKTITLSSNLPTLLELFQLARQTPLLVKTWTGDSYMITPVDELATEVELLRHNSTFLKLLDQFKGDPETISLEQVEMELR